MRLGASPARAQGINALAPILAVGRTITPLTFAEVEDGRVTIGVIPATATPTMTPLPTATGLPARCAGDCDHDGIVAVDQLIRGVRIGLRSLPLAMCPDLDASGEGAVTVDEPLLAVRHALNGCPSALRER